MKEISQLIEPRRVHRSVYTDPEIFQKEMERVFVIIGFSYCMKAKFRKKTIIN